MDQPDLGVYSLLRPVNIDPFGAMQEAQKFRLGQQQTQALADDRQAQAAERQAQTAALQRKTQQDQNLDALMQGSFEDDPNTGVSTFNRQKFEQGLMQNGMGHLYPTLSESLDKLDASAAKMRTEKNQMYANTLLAIDKAGNTPDAVVNGVAYLVKNGALDRGHAQPVLDAVAQNPDPQAVKQLMTKIGTGIPEYQAALDAEQKRQAELHKPVSVAPGASLVDPSSGKPVYTAPPVTSYQSKDVLLDGKRAVVNFDPHGGKYTDASGQDVSTRVAPIPPQPAGGALTAQTDPKAIAAAIQSGDLPPDIAQYSRYATGPIATELAKSGYNLAAAQTDWKATQKHVSTLNGAQQLRLNQSVNALPELLDSVDSLSSQWKGGNFPVLNRANLALAKNGAYGPKAATIANQLDAQIADVTSDLANVYMGGNSPTDAALKLSGKALSSDWDENVLHSMVGLARKNVQIRQNSLRNTGVAGASANNVYAPPSPVPPSVEQWVRDKSGKLVKQTAGNGGGDN